MIGIKVVKHAMEKWALLIMVKDDEKLGSVAVEILDEGKLEKVDETMTVTKHLGGDNYFVFTGSQFNSVVDKFNAEEITFDEVVEL